MRPKLVSRLNICSCAVSVALLTAITAALPANAATFPASASPATSQDAGDEPTSSSSVDLTLPDSPGSVQALERPAAQQHAAQVAPVDAPKNRLTIQASQMALPLSAGAKMGIAFRSIVSPGGFALNVASAGISHATDSRPHFGTDRAGFGERVGSTVYRSSVKSLFGYGIFPAVFHDDPRYYVLGDAAPFKKRLVYAGTRVVFTRKDSGARGVNWPQLLAPIVSQGSANGFYPARDQDVTKTVTGVLVSYATSAGTNAAKEFAADIRRKLHLKQ